MPDGATFDAFFRENFLVDLDRTALLGRNPVHHVRHWSDGGPTAVWNLILLCRLHHRMVHRAGFGVEMNEGRRPVFHRPDGTVMAERAPP